MDDIDFIESNENCNNNTSKCIDAINKYDCNFDVNDSVSLQNTLQKMHIETQNKLDQILLYIQEEVNLEKSKRLVAEKKLSSIEEILEKFIFSKKDKY